MGFMKKEGYQREKEGWCKILTKVFNKYMSKNRLFCRNNHVFFSLKLKRRAKHETFKILKYITLRKKTKQKNKKFKEEIICAVFFWFII